MSAGPPRVETVTIDRAGRLYLDREPIEETALEAHLLALREAEDPPVLFLGMEAGVADGAADVNPRPSTVDRGPLLLRLIERVQRAGVERFALIGEPGDGE